HDFVNITKNELIRMMGGKPPHHNMFELLTTFSKHNSLYRIKIKIDDTNDSHDEEFKIMNSINAEMSAMIAACNTTILRLLEIRTHVKLLFKLRWFSVQFPHEISVVPGKNAEMTAVETENMALLREYN
ncbi:hypothetical protein PV327_011493, partial [Microctonus hyperodae]